MNGILCAYFRATVPSTPKGEATALHPPQWQASRCFLDRSTVGWARTTRRPSAQSPGPPEGLTDRRIAVSSIFSLYESIWQKVRIIRGVMAAFAKIFSCHRFMTLVVGMHLGDSVGVIADSRATVRYQDGRTRYLDNALKV